MMNISRVAVGLSCLRSRGMLPAGQFPEIIVRREYRTHARKNRNIFQEPDKVDTDLRVRVYALLFLFLQGSFKYE